jgi:hypothetical protein
MLHQFKSEYILPKSISTLHKIMRHCKEISTKTYCDVKNNTSFQRQSTDKSFDDILKLTTQKSNRTYWIMLDKVDYLSKDKFLDMGLKVNDAKNERSFYIFMVVPYSERDNLVKKFKIKVKPSEIPFE